MGAGYQTPMAEWGDHLMLGTTLQRSLATVSCFRVPYRRLLIDPR